MTNLETLLLAMLGNKGGGGEGGTTNYNELDNRPQVNGITLTGNKDSEDLNLVDINMIGASYGVAALDGEGKVPESQLPTYPNYDEELSALEEKVDKKANKTFIEDVTSETHVVTVPEDVAGFAAIKMIGGKTVKSKNLLDYKNIVRNSVQGKVSDGFSLNSSSTALTYLLKLKPNTTYTLSKSKAIGDRFRIILSIEKLAVGKSVSGTQPYIFNDSEIHTGTFTTDETNLYCAITFDTTLTLSPSDCGEMLEEGSEATDYEPYFEGLHSAPVESVAIISGDNTVNENEKFFNDGHVGTDTARSRSNALPVDAVADTVIAAVKSKSGKAIDCSFVAYKGTTKMTDTGWNADSVTYTLTDRNFDFAGIGIRYHDNSTIVKDDITLSLNCGKRTTISLTDIVKNLPDYGIGIDDTCFNYVDFENMKYYRKCKTMLVDASWNKRTGTSYTYNTYYSSGISDIKQGTRVTKLLSAKYETKSNEEAFNKDWDKVIYVISNIINITDSGIDSAVGLSGTSIVYELATPEVIDLSDILPPFAVETNGTIEFVNEHNLDVPNTVLYKKEVL